MAAQLVFHKHIPGFEQYTATNIGTIHSWKSGKEKTLVVFNSRTGYQTVQLTKYGETIQKRCSIHRLTALTWLSPYEERDITKLVVNHIDCDKHNNCVENLEYITSSENAIHARQNGLGVKGKRVCQVSLEGELIATFDSMVEAQNQTGIRRGTISGVCVGKQKRKTAGGFMWCFEENFQPGVKVRQNGGTNHAVEQYTLDNEFVKRHENLNDAAEAVSCSAHNIANVCRGHQKTAANHIWKYASVTKKKINPLIKETKDWEILADYPRYKISSDGRVYSLAHQIIMAGSTSPDTTKYVTISGADKKLHTVSVHRLVARAYIPNPHNHPNVTHIDADQANNNVENLKWVKVSYKRNTINDV